ncbi:thiol:disulfide interchange protein DsbA/DsbL [Legionella jamestowniensis]|uniref:Thiol:disulfide interchange protein n=1 Tax=Legionella jamestowniensis TaxID=455 RepID=A0A0W0UJ54_9GAMM|nr:thiol:disulfide interchange protein DsbA/DsbL [Legionella jamestowniensis]KTD07937.1 thiol:disulfide interchange protein precursor DsbA [Legionella jamestowniensis]OCH99070.1 disulfide bond formation protein DsbA [Legionella jamestowniensis]SFL64362.1 Thiol:disulfide interchange protein DsbA [Legionella jamestowniensis DSM 19215]
MLRRLLLIILLLPTLVFADEFVAGKDYELVVGPAANAKSSKIAVTEFFSYGCPWCYRLEPALMTWLQQQGSKVQFSRVPVVFNKDWKVYAKAYYTAHLLGLEAKINPALFKAIQTERRNLANNDAMVSFFTAEGADNATVKSAFENSTMVDLQIAQDAALMSHYHVNGVPAVVINNQYKTDLQMAQNQERFFKILDFLVNKAHQG